MDEQELLHELEEAIEIDLTFLEFQERIDFSQDGGEWLWPPWLRTRR